MWQSRSKALIGESGVNLLASKNVLVVGVGGVGGFALEVLVRCGVNRITVVDGDVFDETNLNRQLLATVDVIGKSKVEVAAQRAKLINPSVQIDTVYERFTESNADRLLDGEYDYVVDCIDSVKDKILLIEKAHVKNFKCISALGAANRLDTDFVATDIYKTQNDGLARAVRKQLRGLGIDAHKVVYSAQKPIESEVLGSMIFPPAAMGILIGKEVILDLLKENTNELKSDCKI